MRLYCFKAKQRAITLLEIMITIALIAGFYALLLPSLSLTSSQVSDSLSLLSQDIRGAFDTAVLDGKVHRLVFDIKKKLKIEKELLGR